MPWNGMGKLGISKVSHGITNLIPAAARRREGKGEREQVRFVSLERDYADYAEDSYFDPGGHGRTCSQMLDVGCDEWDISSRSHTLSREFGWFRRDST